MCFLAKKRKNKRKARKENDSWANSVDEVSHVKWVSPIDVSEYGLRGKLSEGDCARHSTILLLTCLSLLLFSSISLLQILYDSYILFLVYFIWLIIRIPPMTKFLKVYQNRTNIKVSCFTLNNIFQLFFALSCFNK